eukprot:SAG11_NODE_22879_length_398_cov_5.541806_1_plen_63_part_01
MSALDLIRLTTVSQFRILTGNLLVPRGPVGGRIEFIGNLHTISTSLKIQYPATPDRYVKLGQS